MRAIHLLRAEPLQRQVARHFQQEVADEEDAGAQAVGLRVDADRLVHLQRGEADIDPVDVADQVGQQQERHQPPEHPPHRRGFQALVLVAAMDINSPHFFSGVE